MIFSRALRTAVAFLIPFALSAQEAPPKLLCNPAAGQETLRISGARQVYPGFAEFTKITGSVRLKFIITRDGTVRNISVLWGHPLLVQAAIDAVRTWRYAPTLLDGKPVEVLSAVSVDFYPGVRSSTTRLLPFREAVAKHPDDPQHHLALGRALLYETGDVSDAVAEFNEALKLKPGLPEAHYAIAGAVEEKCDFTSAGAEYRKGLELEPKNQMAHRNLARSLEETGLCDQALAEYAEAMRIGPQDALLHYSIGRCLLEKKDADGAVPELREALKREKDFPAANYALGQALEQKGDLKEALQHYYIATKGAKDNPAYAASYNRLREQLQK